MANNKVSKAMTKEQETESDLKRRTARQKRVKSIVQILGFYSAGLGLVFTVRLFRNGDVTNAVIIGILALAVTIIAIAAQFVSELFNSVLDKIDEKLKNQTEPLANLIVNGLENWLFKLWWTLTSDFKGRYYQQLEYACRDYLTQGLDKTMILQLQKVFIPLRITTQDVNSVVSSMIQKENYQAEISQEKSIWDFLAAMKYEPAFRRMVILGAPGSGKTTLLRYITLTYANNTQRKVHPQAPKLIPVLLYLRDIRQEIANNKPPLAELITQEIKKQRRINPDCLTQVGESIDIWLKRRKGRVFMVS